MNWQPISIAPKDGTEILALGNNNGDPMQGKHYAHVFWDEVSGCWLGADNAEEKYVFLDYWMPLPLAPDDQPAQEDPSALPAGACVMCGALQEDQVINQAAQEPVAQFEDPKVQTVYNVLCAEDAPPEGQHWEGWVARKIVDALYAAPQPAQQPVVTPPCKGMNCGCTNGVDHSLECHAEHAAAIAGGQFVKAPQPAQEPETRGDERRHFICVCPDCVKPKPNHTALLEQALEALKVADEWVVPMSEEAIVRAAIAAIKEVVGEN